MTCLAADTVRARLALTRRLVEFSGLYPWQWTCAEVEAFFDQLRSGDRSLALSTLRCYQVSLRLFVEFVCDARYGWPAMCQRRFGQAPTAVLHEWNSMVHVAEFEGRPGRRPLTYDEVQTLFDAADGRVAAIRRRRSKGATAALRDAAILKTVYAYGLRRREVCGLDLADLRHNPSMPHFGRLGGLFVRWGKASRGSAPKRRRKSPTPVMVCRTSILCRCRRCGVPARRLPCRPKARPGEAADGAGYMSSSRTSISGRPTGIRCGRGGKWRSARCRHAASHW